MSRIRGLNTSNCTKTSNFGELVGSDAHNWRRPDSVGAVIGVTHMVCAYSTSGLQSQASREEEQD